MIKVIKKILQILPNKVGSIPYHLTYMIVKVIVGGNSYKIWSRNSYKFKKLEPGISDIDFTLLVENKEEVPAIVSKKRSLQKLIPIIGEMNIYDKKDLYFISKVINHFEKLRDPNLANLLPHSNESQIDKLIFLTRMLESDIQNLNERPKQRLNKWNYHFKHLAIPKVEDELSIRSISKLIDDYSDSRYKASELFEKIVDEKSFDTIYYKYRKSFRIKEIICLLTHRWLVHANGIGDLEICINANDFDQFDIDVICANLKWEAFGIYTQAHQQDQSKNILYTELIILFLDDLYNKTSNEMLISLKESFIELKSLISNI